MKILTFLILAAATCASAQTPPQARIVVHLNPIEKVNAKAGTTVQVKFKATIDPGFHVNSDKPADEYLIPLRLTWTPGALAKPSIRYPKPAITKLAFSEKPASIYSGEFEVVTEFKTASDAKPGPAVVSGKLRYQACNDHECLIPRTVDVEVPVEIVK